MLRCILDMELRSLWRDAGAKVLLALMLVLVAAATFQGARWQRQHQQQLRETQEQDNHRFNSLLAEHARFAQQARPGQPQTDPRLTMHLGRQGRMFTLPLLDTAVMAIGHADLLPQEAHISIGRNESSLWTRLEIENPLHARTGRFDLAFVVVFLLPLFLLAVTFHVLPGDREQGILALSLAQSARLTRLLLTRLAVRGGLVVALFCAAALVLMTLTGVFWYRPESLWRLGLWLALVMGYAAFWLGVVFVVNSYARTAATSALMLAGAWLALVILLPTLFNALLVRVYAPPSRVQLVSAMRTATREATAEASKTLAEFYHAHPELQPAGATNSQGNFAALHFAARERAERDVAPVLQEFARQLEQQQRLVARWRFLLPAVLADEACSDLAGTGTVRHERFRAQVRDALAAWQAWFVPRIVQNAGITVADHDAIPRATYVEEARPDLLRRVLPAVGMLPAGALLLGLWGAMRLRRYPVVS